MGYVLLDARATLRLIVPQFPTFTFKQAVELTLLGVFANISTSTAGTLPLQSYYLYQHGIQVGTGMSTMILEGAFHKLSIFIYSLLTVIFHHQWLKETIPQLMIYIYLGLIICALMTVGMLLLCTWKKIQHLLSYCIHMLPNTEKWQCRKQTWATNLETLYVDSKTILSDRMCCLNVIILNLVKLAWYFSIPYVCMIALGMANPTFQEAHILTCLMSLLIGVLPNIAGVGPTELSFIVLFTPFLGRSNASSCLVLYRVADYFFPFVLSMAVFLKIRKEMTKEFRTKKEEKS